MDILTVVIICLSFGLSFVFALGGVGSALVLIPTLTWLGVPFGLARPTGLFVNTVSMIGATYSNIREKRLDFKLGIPIILASIILAPVGAWVGHVIPTSYVMMAFIGFLLFSGIMMLFFKGSKYADQYRDDRPVLGPTLVGIVAGFFSGLLGVGGGALISPLMILQGFNPKKIAAVTAFAVPFSSFSAFVTYAAMGSVSWRILAFAGLSAWGGGYLGTRVMHRKMRPGTVKKFLGVVLMILALKMIFKLF
ncbi:sulfite exporter TauE/SafE family protein [Desulfoplanes formicivorans]|uniref:Probable membrane transporter protein n=1 Tax=Desulfoplanes formicivorans TaxID=1592317 RepID=A0A194ADX7_9BACT|nr:sulfite exporter TauE/SafE family protein [Desulfoplanes formicivorans]GAU08282.1 permease [Desulfoplanes formicivorans]